MMLSVSSFLGFLEKARRDCWDSKKLKVKHKNCPQLSFCLIFLPASIVSEKIEYLSRTPLNLNVSSCFVQCWQLLWFVFLQGNTCAPCQDTSNFRSFLYSLLFLRYLFELISFWQKFRFCFKLVQTCMLL